MGAIANALLTAVKGGEVIGVDAKLKAGVEAAAKSLLANKGAALVVAGSNNKDIQTVVNAINDAIGANGTTIDFATTVNYRQGIDSDFATLVDDMNAGKVNGILFHGANPVYSWPAADKVKTGLAKVKTKISFSSKVDETAAVCNYVIPDHHFLESWGDAEAITGHISFIQPTIAPLFKTRAFQDSLLLWSGDATVYTNYVKNYWSAKLGGEAGWNKTLQDGVLNPATPVPAAAPAINATVVTAAVAAVSAMKASTKIELALYEKVGIGAGQGASNPWLQELPDPVTRATWDNYIIISPAMAKTLLNIDLNNAGQADAYVTPIVRKLANDLGVNLASVKGTGIGGRIRKEDVEAAAPKSAAPVAATSTAAPAQRAAAPVVATSPLRGTTVTMSRLRKVIAARMVESLQVSAQLTTVVEVDVTKIARLRDR